MMKNLILGAVILAFTGISTVKANGAKTSVTIITQQDSTTKTPVKIDALPDAIKATLSSDKYKEWTPVAAFLIKDSSKAEYYQIDIKKAEETASLKIGKDGVVIE